MITVNCHTNIDCAKILKWPSELPERPVVGDLIRSRSSTNSKYIELEVVRCTWFYAEYQNGWVLDVELFLVRSRYASIADFETHVKSVQ